MISQLSVCGSSPGSAVYVGKIAPWTIPLDTVAALRTKRSGLSTRSMILRLGPTWWVVDVRHFLSDDNRDGYLLYGSVGDMGASCARCIPGLSLLLDVPLLLSADKGSGAVQVSHSVQYNHNKWVRELGAFAATLSFLLMVCSFVMLYSGFWPLVPVNIGLAMLSGRMIQKYYNCRKWLKETYGA